jgi:hypothetical protein
MGVRTGRRSLREKHDAGRFMDPDTALDGGSCRRACARGGWGEDGGRRRCTRRAGLIRVAVRCTTTCCITACCITTGRITTRRAVIRRSATIRGAACRGAATDAFPHDIARRGVTLRHGARWARPADSARRRRLHAIRDGGLCGVDRSLRDLPARFGRRRLLQHRHCLPAPAAALPAPRGGAGEEAGELNWQALFYRPHPEEPCAARRLEGWPQTLRLVAILRDGASRLLRMRFRGRDRRVGKAKRAHV